MIGQKWLSYCNGRWHFRVWQATKSRKPARQSLARQAPGKNMAFISSEA